VIEKSAVDGDYVEGPANKAVSRGRSQQRWLIARLFPTDASPFRFGQNKSKAEIHRARRAVQPRRVHRPHRECDKRERSSRVEIMGILMASWTGDYATARVTGPRFVTRSTTGTADKYIQPHAPASHPRRNRDCRCVDMGLARADITTWFPFVEPLPMQQVVTVHAMRVAGRREQRDSTSKRNWDPPTPQPPL